MRLTTAALSLSCLLLLGACSSKEQGATPASSGSAAPHPGEAIFKKTCFMCHQSGAAGAPMLGDKAAWSERIAQGKEVLYTHALQGFTGSKGTMPPRGANPSLLDDEVKAAVDYMVSKAQ